MLGCRSRGRGLDPQLVTSCVEASALPADNSVMISTLTVLFRGK